MPTLLDGLLAELLLVLLGAVVSVLSSTATLAYWLGRKFAQIDARFAQIDARFTLVEGRMAQLEGRMASMARSISAASAEAHRTVVDFLALKGVVGWDEARYLRERISGVFEAYTPPHTPLENPLTEEEKRVLKTFFEKEIDDITIEEAERVYQIGKRLFSEELDEKGFMLAMAAAWVRGYLVSREVRKRKQEGEKGV